MLPSWTLCVAQLLLMLAGMIIWMTAVPINCIGLPCCLAPEVTTTQQVEAKPLLVMKYIEGHTCSVRRKIHMKEILGSWNMF